VALVDTNIKAAASCITDGQQAESHGHYKEAITLFYKAIDYYGRAISTQKLLSTQCMLGAQVRAIMEKIKELEKRTDNTKYIEANDGIRDGSNNDDERIKSHMSSLKLSTGELPSMTWDDIIGMDELKKLLKRTVQAPLEMPTLFKGFRVMPSSFLLYGPPGVGKTHIVRALANESGLCLYPVTISSLISKYVGESAKNVKAMFDEIKASKPCILFIDEIEALCSNREDNNQHGESSKAITQFLVELDGISKNDMSGVLLVGATNLPWKIDDAVLRRFNSKIYVSLPSLEDRYLLLKYYTSFNCDDVGTPISDDDLLKVAEQTEYFSNSDLKELIKTSYQSTIDNIIDATHFKMSGTRDNFYVIPCEAGEQNSKAITYSEIKDKSKIRCCALTYNDIQKNLCNTRPTVNTETTSKYKRWAEQRGSAVQC
jgi:vacuolar protein-sorting-associated protein 4